MTSSQLSTLLDQLIANWENEIVEFKQASSDNFDTSDIGEYFSALANEANLRNVETGWLIFGVQNKDRKIVGSQYRKEPERLHSLKQQISNDAGPSTTFREIHELHHPDGRVILFEIPAAPRGIPISWKGHYYGRAGESLAPLSLNKLDEIRSQTLTSDWSAQLVTGATLNDLDPMALNRSRVNFGQKYANRRYAGLAAWSDSVFLDRAKLTINGAITRTALLLLGKTESAHFLSPYPAQITWKLVGAQQAYEHFGLPFLLSTTHLYLKIRNIQIRILPDDELLAREISKYDQRIVMEALHNCMAHQDYSRNGRIVVTETDEALTFENEGGFYEGAPTDYVKGEKTPRRYRNAFLTQAMVELGMIDTMGYGIHQMYQGQAARYFPMPDYELKDHSVSLKLHGKIVDPAYTKMLIRNTDLTLEEINGLDRVQKGLPLEEPMLKRLRKRKLVEGKKPNLHVSASVADATGARAEYIRNRSFDDSFYEKLICDYLKKFQSASREEIESLFKDKLSAALDDGQKYHKISNLLTKLSGNGVIENVGSRRNPSWKLCETN